MNETNIFNEPVDNVDVEENYCDECGFDLKDCECETQ